MNFQTTATENETYDQSRLYKLPNVFIEKNFASMASQDAITEDEISGTAQPALSSASSSKPRDACIFPIHIARSFMISHPFICHANKSKPVSEMMSSKRKATNSPSSKPKRTTNNSFPFDGRDGLGQYIESPKNYPPSVVVFHNDSFVAINDLYPKSSVHCLLLPRSAKHNRLHPFDAFADADFLAEVRREAARLKSLVAKELQRKYGAFSKQDESREAVLNGEVDAEELPVGRDWEKEVKVGIHAHPSMNHLHIHVLSVDRHSTSLKHKKHYNSFATPFFVDLEDFPLAEDDARRTERYLHGDMKCWRCGRNFENRFARLKEHLEVEFEEWKRE
jgi:aprataxin